MLHHLLERANNIVAGGFYQEVRPTGVVSGFEAIAKAGELHITEGRAYYEGARLPGGYVLDLSQQDAGWYSLGMTEGRCHVTRGEPTGLPLHMAYVAHGVVWALRDIRRRLTIAIWERGLDRGDTLKLPLAPGARFSVLRMQAVSHECDLGGGCWTKLMVTSTGDRVTDKMLTDVGEVIDGTLRGVSNWHVQLWLAIEGVYC